MHITNVKKIKWINQKQIYVCIYIQIYAVTNTKEDAFLEDSLCLVRSAAHFTALPVPRL
jgi:hypothetical protein